MLVNPLILLSEADELVSLGVDDPLSRIVIDGRALVTTPYQRSANRLREISRGEARHGSCGMGIGETQQDYITYGDNVLFVGDLLDQAKTRAKLMFMRDTKAAELSEILGKLKDNPDALKEIKIFSDPDLINALVDVYGYFASKISITDTGYLAERLKLPGSVIFEGSQGVLLDEWRGFHPYTTWSTTTLDNAYALLVDAGYSGQPTRLGIMRAYQTRHGAGPLVTEDDALRPFLPDLHNATGAWQGDFRIGNLDLVATRYAQLVTGVLDGLVVTHLDRIGEMPEWKVCESYGSDNGEIRSLVPGRFKDLAYQEDLTGMLMKCKPVYTTVSPTTMDDPVGRCKNLLGHIEKAIGVPVVLASYGVDHFSKRIINSCIV